LSSQNVELSVLGRRVGIWFAECILDPRMRGDDNGVLAQKLQKAHIMPELVLAENG